VIYTVTDDNGTTTYRLNVDDALVREAQSVVTQFSTPAQTQIARNMYGPREARFAAVIVQCAADVEKLVKLRDAFEIEHGELKEQLEAQVEELSRMLHEASDIIEDHIVGFTERVEAFRDAATALEDLDPVEHAEPGSALP
jgi:hypothetical protein